MKINIKKLHTMKKFIVLLIAILGIYFSTQAQIKPSQMSAATVEAFKEKLGLNNAITATDTFYTKSQIDAKFESLFSGTYERGAYKYRVQRDSTIIPNWSGIKTAIAGWEFDETSGTTAATAVVGGQTGAALGTVTVNQTGKIGKAYSVVTDGRVNFANSGSLFDFSNTDFTFSIWINPNGVTGIQTIWCLGYDMQFFLDANTVSIDAGAGGLVNSAPTTITASTWTHLAVTYTKSNKEVKIYKNGSLVKTGTLTANPAYNNNQFRLGNINTFNQYNGLYDQCLIWKSALTATQISTYLYNSGNGRLYNQL